MAAHAARMRKWGTFALGILLAVGMLSGVMAAPAQASIQRRYVAEGDDFAVRAFVSGLTGVPMRSAVSFVPKSTTVSVSIKDGVRLGTIPVVVSTAKGARRMCVGSNTQIGDLVTGRTVWLYVLADRGACQSGGTTGLLSIL
jgi:hypothetical protein